MKRPDSKDVEPVWARVLAAGNTRPSGKRRGCSSEWVAPDRLLRKVPQSTLWPPPPGTHTEALLMGADDEFSTSLPQGPVTKGPSQAPAITQRVIRPRSFTQSSVGTLTVSGPRGVKRGCWFWPPAPLLQLCLLEPEAPPQA